MDSSMVTAGEKGVEGDSMVMEKIYNKTFYWENKLN